MYRKLSILAVFIMLALVFGAGKVHAYELAGPTAAPLAAPLGTAFTYQGYLTDGGSPADGEYDFQFMLFDAASVGSQVGVTATEENVDVVEGYFTVELDLGAVFDGTALWLEIGVRPGASTGVYQQLLPRQLLTAVPYASYASQVAWSGLSGVPAGFADGVDNDTPYSAGTGLTLSGGAFSLTTPYRLPQGCAIGQITEWNGSAWVCAADANSGGDITAVTAGTGLAGGGTSGAVTLGVHFAGSGSATTVARSDQDHWGQTWTGSGMGLALSGGLTGLYATGTNYGVYGLNTSTSGMGVYGYTSAASGPTAGLSGQSNSNSGYGTTGHATATSGTTYGVWGETDSSDGYGGYFVNSASNGTALYATGSGAGVDRASLSVLNTEAAGGVAAYISNSSTSATSHIYNGGSGVVLYLHNGGTDTVGTGGGDFIKAENKPEGDVQFRVSSDGRVYSDLGYRCGSSINDTALLPAALAIGQNEASIEPCLMDDSAADFAEMLPSAGSLEPGDVLSINADGNLAQSSEPYQTTVVGVYSSRPSFLGNAQFANEDGYAPLVLLGLVSVKVSAENGAIQPGDLLVASSTPGHAMRAGENPPQGTVIGKALEPLTEGTGLIKILVTLQ